MQQTAMQETVWYFRGLRFQCTQCGDCCTGEPGYVWVSPEEVAALAAEIGEPDLENFERIYVRRVGMRRSLKELANGDCVFFDAARRICTVYRVRPRQCRSWPFWDSNVRTPKDWERACAACPGCGKGRLHLFPEIEANRGLLRI